MADNGVKFEIEGLAELNKLLESLPKDLQDKLAYDINRQAGNIAAQVIRENVPVGDNDKPADEKLENNVVVAKGKGKTTVLVGFNKKAGAIARWIEKGTKVRATSEGENRGEIEPQPFIEKAHQKALPAIISFMNTNYLKLIERSMRKHIKKLNKR
jgi:HK97 gp10 family phage protein